MAFRGGEIEALLWRLGQKFVERLFSADCILVLHSAQQVIDIFQVIGYLGILSFLLFYPLYSVNNR